MLVFFYTLDLFIFKGKRLLHFIYDMWNNRIWNMITLDANIDIDALANEWATILACLPIKLTNELGKVLSKSLHLDKIKWKYEICVEFVATSSIIFLQSISKVMFERLRSFAKSRTCRSPQVFAPIGSRIPLKWKVFVAIQFHWSSLIQMSIPYFLSLAKIQASMLHLYQPCYGFFHKEKIGWGW